MESCYVPPHLRKRPASTAEPDVRSAPTAEPSAMHECNSQARSDDDLYTVQEINDYFWEDRDAYEDAHSATLHSSAESPNGLSWVLLFNGANPKWNENGVIFVKSNLELLPAIMHPPETKPIIAIAKPERRLDELGEEGGVMLPTDSKATDEEQDQNVSDGAHEPAADEAVSTRLGEGVPVDHPPIAVFSQPIRRDGRSFKFIGWYKIV